MQAATRFQCSAVAAETWRLLRFCYDLVNAGELKDSHGDRVVLGGDPQVYGMDWAKRSLGLPPQGNHADLGTEARIRLWDAQSRLMLLEARGSSQQAGVAVARRRLTAHGLTDVVRRFGLVWCGRRDDECAGCDAHELLSMVKEWLGWALGDGNDEEPGLPWAQI